jgi:hypothetical protein
MFHFPFFCYLHKNFFSRLTASLFAKILYRFALVRISDKRACEFLSIDWEVIVEFVRTYTKKKLTVEIGQAINYFALNVKIVVHKVLTGWYGKIGALTFGLMVSLH